MGGNMLLRNKKTGQEGNFIINKDHFECVDLDCVPLYFSLSELLDEWEDYTPKEPLIKDEKIRKAIRAWAEANNIRAVYYSPEEDGFYVKNFDDEIVASIYFGDKPIEEDGYGEHYTIAELCGEEE